MDPTHISNTLAKTPRQLFIDGKFVDAHAGATVDTINPHTGKAVAAVSAAQPADVDAAVSAARQAFDTGPWPRMTGKERALRLRKWANKLRLYEPEVALLESVDVGKPLAIAKHVDVPFAISVLEYYAGWADGKICGEMVPLGVPEAWGYTLNEPRGVCGAIIPWNFPLVNLVLKVAPALAAGCTTVVKISEETPLSALYVADLCLLADIPDGVVNIMPGNGDAAGAALAAHPGINHLSFTGSTEVGKQVAAAAARNVVPCTLELGGKSPLIVWKDADVDEAVELSHNAIMFNTGQCCNAASRTLVHKDIYDEFVGKATACAQSTRVGDPLDPSTELGPQASEAAMNKTLGYINGAVADGACLHTGGKRIGEAGYALEPAVFSNVRDDMTLAKEEVFGPVHTIMTPYSTLDEVVERANATHYGLAAGVLAKDIDVVNTLTRSIKCGSVWVNSFGEQDVAMPFGGYKHSGIGREHGSYGLQPYINVKAVYAPVSSTPWR